MACFPKRLVLPSAAAISRRCCKTAPVSPSEITVLCPLEGLPDASRRRPPMELRVTDQTALSFASETAPAEGVAVVFAEEGARLSSCRARFRQEIERFADQGHRHHGIQGQKGADGRSDRPAGPEIRASRAGGAGQAEQLRAGGLGQSWRHGEGAHQRQGSAGGACLPRERRAGRLRPPTSQASRLVRCCAATSSKNTRAKSAKKDGAAGDANDKSLKKIVIHCGDPKGAGLAFGWGRALADGVMLARDLVNEPANVLGPAEFAAQARRSSPSSACRSRCSSPKALEKLGMGALLAVGQGSVQAESRRGDAVEGRRRQGRRTARHRRQGRHLRHRRHLAQARRRHGGHEGRHGRRGLRRRADAGARRAQGQGQRRRHRRPRREHAVRQRAASGRRRHLRCRDRPSRCSTPTPKAAWCSPTVSGTRRSASSRRR